MPRPGQWLQPRHASAEAFEKDFGETLMRPYDVYCPGCKAYLRLNRRNPAGGRIGGWCKACQRGVTP